MPQGDVCTPPVPSLVEIVTMARLLAGVPDREMQGWPQPPQSSIPPIPDSRQPGSGRRVHTLKCMGLNCVLAGF